jgi:DNA ligase-1
MLPYERIARALDEIGHAPRGKKADIASSLLIELPPETLCPVVRLLMGDLWPSWKPRELGIGPQSITAALEEISKDDITSLWSTLHEMGAVVESALQHKAQHPLSVSPLDALVVYNTLRRISRMSGPESEHRKIAALRGLMMDASPLEGKYIAHTALGNMAAGLGPQTMIAAISQSFRFTGDEVSRAYNLMPDPGMLALAARQGTLSRIEMLPARPIKPMLLRPGIDRDAQDEPLPAAHLPLYPGLKVQVHRAKGQIYVYTTRLKNITIALAGLTGELQDLDLNHEMILEAELMGFLDRKAVSQAEMVRYINRRHFARRSRASPALMAYDLLYLDGEDLTGLAYQERRKKLIDILGEPKEFPFKGISSAKENVLTDPEEVKSYLAKVQKQGCKGLIVRDLRAPYTPGCYSSSDFLFREDR